MASLQHLGGDRWRVRIYVDTDTNGNARTVSRVFRAKGQRAADRHAAAVEAELREQVEQRQAAAAERRGSINELVDDWLNVKERTSSPTTMTAYRRHAERIKARFGNVRAAELTGSDIDAWYTELRQAGATDAGIAVAHRHLRAVLRFGYKKRGLPAVATDRATPSSHQPPEVDPPTPQRLMSIVGALPAAPQVQWSRAVALIVFTGVRRGELVGLRWEDWDQAAATITVRHSVVEVEGGIVVRPYPKGKKPRRVPLVPGAELVLTMQRQWLDSTGRDSPWVFPDIAMHPDGSVPRRPGWISLMWARNRAKCGADGVRLHELRHAFATLLLDDNVPVNTVQAWLGHAKASTTLDIYGHRGKAGDLAGREALRRALPAGAPAPEPRRRVVVRRRPGRAA